MNLSRVTKIRLITVVLLIFIVLVASIPYAFAKPRKTYITDFLMECLIDDEGFANSQREEYRDDNDEV